MLLRFGVSCVDGEVTRTCEEIRDNEKSVRLYDRLLALESWYESITNEALRDTVKTKAWIYAHSPYPRNWTPDGWYLANAYRNRVGQPYAESIEAAMREFEVE
jgi:hypothetical protein